MLCVVYVDVLMPCIPHWQSLLDFSDKTLIIVYYYDNMSCIFMYFFCYLDTTVLLDAFIITYEIFPVKMSMNFVILMVSLVGPIW